MDKITENQCFAPNNGEVILYNPDDTIRLEVRMNDETVWLSQAQMVELFQSSKANISEHIKSIFQQQELEKDSTVRFFRIVQREGTRMVTRNVEHYNLDMIISVGYRVNTKRGILFRKWATEVLKNFMLKGYDRHNAQYPPILVKRLKKSHDRFLILDDDLYSVGASLKDMGKKWFAILKMQETKVEEILERI